jgi:hypothetical protein
VYASVRVSGREIQLYIPNLVAMLQLYDTVRHAGRAITKYGRGPLHAVRRSIQSIERPRPPHRDTETLNKPDPNPMHTRGRGAGRVAGGAIPSAAWHARA